MSRRFLVLAVVAAIVVGACGGSGGGASSGKGKEYVDALVANRSDNDFTKSLTESQTRCLATKMVDAVGVGTLEKAGITPKNIAQDKGLNKLEGKVTKDQANEIVDALLSGDCFDFADLVVKQSGDSSLKKLSKTQLNCLFKNMFDLPGVRDELANSLIGGKDPSFQKAFGNSTQLFAIFSKCKISLNQLQGT
jgi:hypothetical protein